MANWDDNSGEDNKNGLTEIEQMQLDAVMLETAYNNSYLVLTNQITFEDLLTERFTKGGEAVMAFDPSEGPMQEELENMIPFERDIYLAMLIEQIKKENEVIRQHNKQRI